MYLNRFFRLFGCLLLLWVSGVVWPVEPGVTERLRDAEAQLVLAEGVYGRVEDSYCELQKNPDASAEEVLAMESYVNELGEMVTLRKQTLEDLQKIAGMDTEQTVPGVEEGMEAFETAVDQVPDTAGPETEQEKLDREFKASLEDFDGMILAYNERLEAQMDQRIAQGEATAGKQQSAVEDAQALLKSMGVDLGKAGEPGSETAAGESESTDANKDSQVAGKDPSGTVKPPAETGETAGTAASGRPGAGEHRAPAVDEDIVARQLREAAEKETDPVLREKLWKEYEAYLDGRS